MTRKLVVIGAVSGLLALILFQSVSGLIGRNTFDPEASLTHGGRMVWVTAQIACTAGERLSVEVTLTQESSLALGRGQAHTVCEPVDLNDPEVFQEIPVRVIAQGRETFQPGNAIATGLAISKERGQKTGLRQWQPADGIVLVNGN